MKQLSIIIPVYNVEKYIKECIESIYRQGLDENYFELILVNDGTKDKSMDIIVDVINKHNNIVVINQENQGPSIARNNGLERATGDFILFVDSDDLLINNSLPRIIEKAYETKTDLLIANLVQMNDTEIKDSVFFKEQKQFVAEIHSGENIYIKLLNPNECFPVRTIYKREFLIKHKIRFIPNIFYEDIPFTHECYIKAEKCIKTNIIFYIYRMRNNSTTHSFNYKTAMDYSTAIAMTWHLTYIQDLSPLLLSKLKDNIFVSFSTLVFFVANNIKGVKGVNVLNNIVRIAPDLNFKNGFKQKLFYLMLLTSPHALLKIRYYYSKIIEERLYPLYNRLKKISNY